MGPELRIRPYRRTLVPNVMFFKNPKPEWKQESATYIDQIPDLAVEIVSPSNKGKKWEANLAVLVLLIEQLKCSSCCAIYLVADEPNSDGISSQL